MKPRILVVEDEEDLRDAIEEYLVGRGLEVFAAANADEGRKIAARTSIDIAVLDIAMPGESGLSLARWLRQQSKRIGIIFATSAGSSNDRIVGLEIGADDYLAKPFELRELLARLRSVLRRLDADVQPNTKEDAGRRVIEIGELTMLLEARQISDRNGQIVELTSSEFDLLAMLATRPNRVLSRQQLLAGDGDNEDANLRSVDIRITRLRSKIETEPQRPLLIQTVRGEGYMFVPASTGQAEP